MNIGKVLGTEAKALWGGGKGSALVLVATTWSVLLGARMILPVVLPEIQATFELSLTMAGLLVTVLWFFAAIGQLPGGVLADGYHERTVMAIGVLVVAASIGLVVVAPTVGVLFLATALWGLGHSMYPIARITFLSATYPKRLGSALGVTMAMGDVGQTILPPVAAVLVALVAWQAGVGFVAPLLVVLAIVILLTLPAGSPPSGSSVRETASNARGVLGELRDPSMGLLTAILFLYIFIWQTFTAFYPTYLVTVKGFSGSVASLLFGFFFAVGAVVKPVSGAAYDRIGMRLSLVGVLIPPVAGFVLLPFVDNVWLLVGITACVSAMLGSGAITQSYLAESFAEEIRGTGLGVVRTLTAMLGATGPVVFGAVADRGYFDEGYIALAGLMVLVIVLTLRMPAEDDTTESTAD